MKRCNIESKWKWKTLEDQEVLLPIKNYDIEMPICKGMLLDKSINSLIRDLDAKENEKKVIQQIEPNY